MRSIQWDKVAKIPAVVALNVIASPLKSMPLIPLGVSDWSTAQKRTMLIKTNAPCAEKNNVLYSIPHQWVCKPEWLLHCSTLPSTVYLNALKGDENISKTMKLEFLTFFFAVVVMEKLISPSVGKLLFIVLHDWKPQNVSQQRRQPANMAHAQGWQKCTAPQRPGFIFRPARGSERKRGDGNEEDKSRDSSTGGQCRVSQG